MIWIYILMYLFIGYVMTLAIYINYKDTRAKIKENAWAACVAALLWPVIILIGLAIYPFEIIDKKERKHE